MRTRKTPRGFRAFISSHWRKKTWVKAVACMAVLVVFCTVYALVMPAVALNGETYCGKTEHTHDKTCYESVLTCGMEEGKDGHVHDDSCYEEQLVCEKEEHTHTDACYVNPDAKEETEAKAESDTASKESDDSTKATTEVKDDSKETTTEVSSETTTEEASETTTEDAEEQTAEADATDTSEETTEAENAQSTLEAAALPEGAQIPDGYTEQYTVRDDANGYAVTVYAPEGVVPEGAELKAELLDEADDAYAVAEEALADETQEVLEKSTETAVNAESSQSTEGEAEEPSTGFAAMDIHFEDVDGNEVEPNGDVYVVIDAVGLLPEDADPETVAVQHHAEQSDGVTVETVADTTENTSGVVAAETSGESGNSNVQAAFAVSGFSTFTISWENNDDSAAQIRVGEPGTISTADTISRGVNISLYDYLETINGSIKNNSSQFAFSGGSTGFNSNVNDNKWFNHWTQKEGGVSQGIVDDQLTSNGYPALSSGISARNGSGNLGYLFGAGNSFGVSSYENLNHLFTYDSTTGYYSFDSSQNFATINPDGNSTTSTNFTVYSQPNSGTSSGSSGHPYFLPFNTYGTGENDGANYHFGMKITTEFLMPKDGQINGQDMTFSFSGDDDVWVYIDGVLILDMGGIHDSNSGWINFGNGTATVDKVYYEDGSVQNNRSDTVFIGDLLAAVKDDNWISANLDYINDHYYLKDYTTHDFAFFYLERGAVDSNCAITFNLYTLQKNSLSVGKELETASDTTEEIDNWLGNLEYIFRVLKANVNPDTTDPDDLFIAPGTSFDIYDSSYQDTGENGTVSDDGTFTLKAGQYAVFTNIDENAGSYYVQELIESEYSAQFGSVNVSVNPAGGDSTLTDDNGAVISNQKFSGVISNDMEASNTGYVIFTNNVDTENFSLLTITKAERVGSDFGDKTFSVYVDIDGEPVEGTYGSGENTVTFSNGIADFSIGTSVSIPVLTGAEFTIYEIDGADYNVEYSAEQIFRNNISGLYNLTENNDSHNSISGEVGDIGNTELNGNNVEDATNAVMDVTLTNSSYDFNTSLPIKKTLEGWESGDNYSFGFVVTQVKENGGEISANENVSPVGTSISIQDTAINTGTIYFNFNNAVNTGKYYFKVNENIPESSEGVSYDSSYYIVEVEVSSTNEGGKAASVTKVVKYNNDGTQDDSFDWEVLEENEKTLSFTNNLITSVTVEKRNEDKTIPLADAEFQLYYTVTNDDGSTTNYYYYAEKDSEGNVVVTWSPLSDDSITSPSTILTSDNDGLIEIEGLRMDTTYYLVETKAPDGYQLLSNIIEIYWENDTLKAIYSGGSDNLVDLNTNHIIITNTTGTELPETGGTGTTLITISGLLLMAAAVGGGYGLRRKREERY